ncbi:MAG: hypothetical protein U1E63_06765 [Burkholderiales bacterium]
MTAVILFAVGSSIVVDVEESVHRRGLTIAAGIRNREGPCHLSPGERVLTPEELDASLRQLPYLVPLFTPGHRQEAAREATRYGLCEPFRLIDPTAAAPRRLELGPGSYINALCSLGGGSRFGAFTFINRGASIGHHAVVGDFVSIGPGAVIAGHVTIGTGSVVATAATILPEITIGANAVVSAGAVVTQDVPSGCLVAGNPARIVRDRIGGYKGVAVT